MRNDPCACGAPVREATNYGTSSAPRWCVTWTCGRTSNYDGPGNPCPKAATRIVITCKSEILREDGSTPFWEGPADRIGEIRSLVARDLAVDVVKDGKTRKSGMWTVEART